MSWLLNLTRSDVFGCSCNAGKRGQSHGAKPKLFVGWCIIQKCTFLTPIIAPVQLQWDLSLFFRSLLLRYASWFFHQSSFGRPHWVFFGRSSSICSPRHAGMCEGCVARIQSPTQLNTRELRRLHKRPNAQLPFVDDRRLIEHFCSRQ